MKKHTFYLLLLIFCFQLVPATVYSQQNYESQQFFQIMTYHFDSAEQQQKTDRFLEQAYLPALHRLDIDPVGVFKPHKTDTAAALKTYLLIPFKSLDEFASLPGRLNGDSQYLAEGEDYLEAPHDEPPYHKITSTLLRAFEYAPTLMAADLDNPKTERVYELRSYESATELLNRNKVDMFNAGGEVEIFDRLDFNAIFYGNVISGNKMPNLMYMTTFENMESRNAHWDAFRNDARWEELSAMEKYQDNVSNSDIYFLRAASYSDL
ncbi:NIPSNAP protein [Fodinibius roseus]|uniref:NIPSNAP protein n=1 Tax=Fodinibius roseus TaxID=1194090 RepID=A0A1M4V7N4_9BACT|nr:NIPSNAP family protein [Fodinibius roseus]SHE64897.1 NIPSNAP protein [Fodinibius roseus]